MDDQRRLEAVGGADPIPSAVLLPVVVDADRMRAEVAKLGRIGWTPHFNASLYEGNWSGVALRAAAGAEHAVAELHNPPSAERFCDLSLLDRCPSVRAVIDGLACEVRSVRLLELGAGAEIREHTDHELAHRFGEARLHAPVETNDRVDFRIAGERVVMRPGELWYVDASKPHSVRNGGTTDRVHLVIDVGVNAWFDELVRRGESPCAAHRAEPAPSAMHSWPLVSRFHEPVAGRIVEFVRSIGLDVRTGEIDGPTLLPGIDVVDGAIWIDPSRLAHPGDVLHEAGHLAVLAPAERAMAGDSSPIDGGFEMAAIAWSWAALTHLGLDPREVFHEDGYRGDAAWLIETFSVGNHIGLPVLQWLGLAVDAERAAELGIEPFPRMIGWVRD